MSNNIKMIKCPYCGSIDKLIRVDNYFKCKYCDCDFYIASDETKKLLNDAQRNLKNYKFDDADDIYRIISRQAKANDDYNLFAMAEWGRLLAYFGVVYIKGFSSDVSVPTIVKYDSRYKSVKDCDSFYSIIRSDCSAEIKNRYIHMADNLDLTYSKIGSELKKTPEYDVFLCVKISTATEDNPDSEGLTRDSKDADIIYNELTNRGLKVFYSDRSCQGIEYDSQILGALSRSKLLLVISRKKKYLESAWVASEWRRWLTFIENGDKKRNSLLLYTPELFELPTILKKKKIQYFDDSISVINHIVESTSKKNKASKDDRIKDLLKEIDELKKNQVSNSTLDTEDNDVKLLEKANDLYRSNNYNDAYSIYEHLADKNNSEALNKLGDFYLNGYVVDKNEKKAIELKEKSASLGNKDAIENLASFHFHSGHPDYPNYFKWCLKLAELNEFQYMYRVGMCYEKGKGTPVNYDQALYWYKKAADLGSNQAKESLAALYESFRDYDKAFKLYYELYKQNKKSAALKVAYMYQNGFGVAKNVLKAYEIKSKAKNMK